MASINPTSINVPFDKLEKIIHISDVHIRLFKRHKEYRHAFDNLYNDLKFKGQIFENSVIVMAGDLLHAKTDISPEMLSLASEFLKKLADIAPTLLIIGNHDMNLANTHRLDSLTPMVENITHDNLYYLRDSGVYTVADTDFSVFSIIGDKKLWPKPKQCKSPNKIVLCHAPVNNAQTDRGFVLTNRHLDVSAFDGYDMVLLGDIHKTQILQDFDKKKKKPLIAYAGSLIQQNHGENLEGHGWLEWDVPKRRFEFRPLHNDYGYYTLYIENGKIPDLSHIPKNVRLRVFVKDIEPSKVKKIQTILAKKFNLQEFIVNKMRDSKLTLQNRQHATELVDVSNLETQNQLIDDYLTANHALVDKDVLNRVHRINATLNSQISEEDIVRNIQWKPLLFEFSNMFSYGDGNAIDFEALNGLHGLFSGNTTGKSAAFDALMFCLFDKTPRAFKGSHIMNSKKSKFRCYLKFEANGEEYEIERIGKRKKNGEVRVDVNFQKTDSSTQETISLNAEDRRSTNAIIRRYVGNYDDFILTNLSLQNNHALFIDKGQSERKDLLSQFMGINIFDKLYYLALEEFKAEAGALRMLSKTDRTKELADSQRAIDKLSKEYKEIEEQIDDREDKLEEVEKEISTLLEKKTPLDIGNIDIQKLEKTKHDVAQMIDDYTISASDLEKKYEELLASSGSLVEAKIEYDEANIDSKYEIVTKCAGELQYAQREMGSLHKRIQSEQKKLDHMITHEFDPECEFCVKNNQNLVRTAEQLRQELTESRRRRDELKAEIEELERQLENADSVRVDYEHAQEVRKTLLEVDRELLVKKASLSDIKSNITTKKSRLQSIEDKIKKYHKSVDIIKKNAEIDEKVSDCEQTQEELEDEIKMFSAKLRGAHGKLQVEKTNKTKILSQISEMEELEQTVRAYEYYIDAIKRDGIPYELIRKVIPSIESEVNNILSQMVDFTLKFDLDGKNINGRICYGDEEEWPLEMSSGMERFINSLAIRVALLTVSNLPKPNFLVIDEGLGTLESENLMKMHMLFSILKNQFDFVVVISHLEAVRDMVDALMEIQVENGYSKINY